ncbi:unnamed protein product [Pleuronectes platessa]|uniref:Uncharacterized protein n=1 Tax=Pleuronectes platessa TaxID=8262 RepID=A0A9N7UQJ4_PLEPL|nr:unnamed protein product [Pleuronectes platessa]
MTPGLQVCVNPVIHKLKPQQLTDYRRPTVAWFQLTTTKVTLDGRAVFQRFPASVEESRALSEKPLPSRTSSFHHDDTACPLRQPRFSHQCSRLQLEPSRPAPGAGGEKRFRGAKVLPYRGSGGKTPGSAVVFDVLCRSPTQPPPPPPYPA